MCQSASSCRCAASRGAGGSGRARRPRSRRAGRGTAFLRVGEPDAVTGDEGDVVSRVGGSSADPAVSSDVMRPPPSRRSPRRRRRAVATTAAFSFGTIPPPSSPAASIRSAFGETRIVEATAPPSKRPGTSVTKSLSAPRPTASAAAASSAFTFRGRRREAPRPGRAAPGGQRVLDRRRRRGSGEPTCPSSATRTAARPISSSKSGTAGSADRSADLRVDGGQRVADDGERSCARHAPSVDETDFEPGTREFGRDLRPGPVDDADVVLLRQGQRAWPPRPRPPRRPRARCAPTSGSPR